MRGKVGQDQEYLDCSLIIQLDGGKSLTKKVGVVSEFGYEVLRHVLKVQSAKYEIEMYSMTSEDQI